MARTTTVVPAGLHPRDRLLVFYDGPDEDGSYAHDRVLLAQVTATRWVVCTPHFDVYLEDIEDYAAVYPEGRRGGIHYSLQHHPRVQFREADLRDRLDDLVADGETEAEALRDAGFVPNGDAVVPAGPGIRRLPPAARASHGPLDTRVWVSMEDVGSIAMGDPVVVDGSFVCRGNRGIHSLADGTMVAVAAVGTWAVPALDQNDLRILPVLYQPGDSKRGRPFTGAIPILTETQFTDWPLDGPRTVLWLLGEMAKGDHTPLRRHFWWRSVLALQASDPYVSEHEFLSELFECGVCFDQVNASQLLFFEHVSRRYQLIEEMYKEKLRTAVQGPSGTTTIDDDEVSLFAGKASHAGIALVSPALASHIASKVAERSSVLKERRKGREERRLATLPTGPASPGGQPPQGNKNQNKAEAKAHAKAKA